MSNTTFDERLKEIKDYFLGDNEVAGALYDTSEVGELHPEVKEYIKWLIEQAERVEELKKHLEQVKKTADFLLFQIGLARSISLIKAEFSGEEELYKALKALKEEIHFT